MTDQQAQCLNDLCREFHDLAKAKGWWDTDRTDAETGMMVVTEIAEALQILREWFPHVVDLEPGSGKPFGFPAELADVLIRLLDWAGRHGIALGDVVKAKHEFNKSRPIRHGKKF